MDGPKTTSEGLSSLPLFLRKDVCAGDCSAPNSKNSAAPSLDRLKLQPLAPLSGKVRENSRIQVSVILPVYNADSWLDECLQSVLDQDFQGSIELSVFNDASTDNSEHIIQKWKVHLEEAGIRVVLGRNHTSQPRGVGFAKNHAVDHCSGMYLCFLDSDDVMMPQRIRLQWEAAIQHPKCIIGCQIKREPVEATERYTMWINSLTEDQLLTQLQKLTRNLFCAEEAFWSLKTWGRGLLVTSTTGLLLPRSVLLLAIQQRFLTIKSSSLPILRLLRGEVLS